MDPVLPPRDVGAMPRRAALVVNPKSRSGQRVRDRAAARLREVGVRVDIVAPTSAGDLDAAVRQLGDADVVVIGGGDGTLNAAAPALVELGRPVAILPLGTANDLARTLGLPRDPIAACEVITHGEPKAIDVGRANGRHFFNAASVGLSVTVARRLSGARKRRWGVFGYPVAVLDALRGLRTFHANIECDGDRLELEAVQVAIGNGRYYGGGMAIDDDATIDEGLLHVYAIEAVSVSRLLVSAPFLRLGRHEWLRSSWVRAGRHIRVQTRPQRSVNTDGEITGRTPLEADVIPGALTVLVPPTGRTMENGYVSD